MAARGSANTRSPLRRWQESWIATRARRPSTRISPTGVAPVPASCSDTPRTRRRRPRPDPPAAPLAPHHAREVPRAPPGGGDDRAGQLLPELPGQVAPLLRLAVVGAQRTAAALLRGDGGGGREP